VHSIGELSRRTGVKVPTVRYYEESGIMPPPDRTQGNQRRYDGDGFERLAFIRHARNLGFSLHAIAELIALRDAPDRSCQSAGEIAKAQLISVRRKIARLRALETELSRMFEGCDGQGASGECYILAAGRSHAVRHRPRRARAGQAHEACRARTGKAQEGPDPALT